MRIDRPYCAPATPPGVGGIALIRMSGQQSIEIADRIFCIIRTASQGITSVQEMPAYTCAYGRILDPVSGRVIDEAVLTVFHAPHSYTGDHLVEIACHGGSAVKQDILQLLYEYGARPAEPGEFTKNAFLSGKMDLTQAESVMDIISAESSLALSAAESQLMGAIKKEIRSISENLYNIFASIEMNVEFPEHEESIQDNTNRLYSLKKSIKDLESLSKSYNQGRILSERMNVVLAGIPNSGKSSLLNRLSGYDRAIVTPIAGTTRDTLEVVTSLSGIPVSLIDTAGLRETIDEIEQMGVSRAYEAVKYADLLLWLVDPSEKFEDDDMTYFEQIADLLPDGRVGILVSKSDLIQPEEADRLLKHILSKIDAMELSEKIRFSVAISSETNEGIHVIIHEIQSLFDSMGQSQSDIVLTNHRHYIQVEKSVDKLKQTLFVLENGEPLEIACTLIRSAMDDIGEITGDCVSDTLVDTIFSRFCIGK